MKLLSKFLTVSLKKIANSMTLLALWLRYSKFTIHNCKINKKIYSQVQVRINVHVYD